MSDDPAADNGVQPPAQDPTPPTPPEAPPGQGQGDPGEGGGEGGGQPWDPSAHAAVTKAQQEASDARRAQEEATNRSRELELELARAQGAQQQQPQAPASQPDPNVAAVDELLEKSSLVQGMRGRLAQQDAQLAELGFDSRPEKFPLMKDPKIRQAVMNDMKQTGGSDLTTMEFVYGKHAAPVAQAQASDAQKEIARLTAELDLAKKGQAGNTDLQATDLMGAPGRGGGGGAAPATSQANDMDTLEAMIDKHKAEKGL